MLRYTDRCEMILDGNNSQVKVIHLLSGEIPIIRPFFFFLFFSDTVGNVHTGNIGLGKFPFLG